MKLLSLHTLARVFQEYREQGLKIVLANGCFDVPHAGHIAHLQAAKKLGNILCVTVTQDHHVGKGPGRPLFPVQTRCEVLAALSCVDYVTINTPIPGEAIKLLKPHIYAKGPEYRHKMTPNLWLEEAEVKKVGGELVFTDTPEFHSTEILSRLAA